MLTSHHRLVLKGLLATVLMVGAVRGAEPHTVADPYLPDPRTEAVQPAIPNAPAAPAKEFLGAQSYEVIHAVDGDTVHLMIRRRLTKVRLLGLDVPTGRGSRQI